ncbi:hypothetical protein KIPB_011993, partial [Kipferlia bialata]
IGLEGDICRLLVEQLRDPETSELDVRRLLPLVQCFFNSPNTFSDDKIALFVAVFDRDRDGVLGESDLFHALRTLSNGSIMSSSLNQAAAGLIEKYGNGSPLGTKEVEDLLMG